MREVNKSADGRIILRAGTLYTALDRLLDEGLITETGSEIVDGRNRRYYSLTEHGIGVLEAEVQRMRSHANRAASRLRSREVES